MQQLQECYDCAYCKDSLCKHPKRDERLWGEDGADDRHGECPLFEDREAVRCAVNGVET